MYEVESMQLVDILQFHLLGLNFICDDSNHCCHEKMSDLIENYGQHESECDHNGLQQVLDLI